MDTQELVDTIRNASAPYRIILLDGARFTVSRESGRYILTGITSEGRHSIGGEGETISVSPIRIINLSGPAECAEVSLYDSSHRRTFHISIDPGAVERVARRLRIMSTYDPEYGAATYLPKVGLKSAVPLDMAFV